MFKVLYLRHHSEPVASPNLDNILLAIFAAQQLEGEIDEFRRVGEPPDAAVSIKVGTQTYVVDTHHIDGMLKMGDSVHDVGFTLFTQESVIERGMSHTTLCCEGTHLVIGQIARHIAERTAAAMAADNRRLADIKCIVETLLATMTQIYHDAQAVHLLNYLLAKTAHTIMGIAAAGTIADIIITIMAERDINDAALGEMLHVTDIVLQGETVLDAEHDALSAFPLIAVKIGRSTGYAEILAVLAHNLFYLVEDEVGILRRSLYIKSHLAAEALAYLRLWQVSYHRGSILMTIGHLMEINQDAGIAMIKLDALREEHRSITMGIERKDALMQLLGCIKVVSLINQPLENLQSFFFQPFRMPLHTENLLIFATLYSLYNIIGRFGDGAQMIAWLAYRLMVERVDKDLLLIIYII